MDCLVVADAWKGKPAGQEMISREKFYTRPLAEVGGQGYLCAHVTNFRAWP